jgi:uncharacterized protein (DUF305 family)
MKRSAGNRFSVPALAVALVAAGACNKQRTDEPKPSDTPTAAARTNEGTTQAASEAVQQPGSSASFDQRFIDMMTPHHQAGVEAARIAEQRATRPELKSKTGEMIAKQTKEIAQLKTWRKQWFGSDVTPPMSAMPMLTEMAHAEKHDMGHGKTHDMSSQIATLRTAEDFDQAFVGHMIAHHKQAIDAARLAEQKAEHAELKQFASKLASDQERETKQLEQWRTQWSAK